MRHVHPYSISDYLYIAFVNNYNLRVLECECLWDSIRHCVAMVSHIKVGTTQSPANCWAHSCMHAGEPHKRRHAYACAHMAHHPQPPPIALIIYIYSYVCTCLGQLHPWAHAYMPSITITQCGLSQRSSVRTVFNYKTFLIAQNYNTSCILKIVYKTVIYK